MKPLEELTSILFLAVMITQVLVPVIFNRPMFWLFRSKPKLQQARTHLADAA